MLRLNLTISERVLIVRRRLGWTQAQLGKLLGVSWRWIAELESVRAKPGCKRRSQMMEKWEVIEVRYRDQIESSGRGRGR